MHNTALGRSSPQARRTRGRSLTPSPPASTTAHNDPAPCDVSWRCLRLLTSLEITKTLLLISACLRYAALHALSASTMRKGPPPPQLPSRFGARGPELPRFQAFAPLPLGSSRISHRPTLQTAGRPCPFN